MLRGGTVITLHEMKAMDKSIRAIARETGHSRNTVRKYLRSRELPQPKVATDRPSKLDPFKPFLPKCFADGIYNCEVLLRFLREKGYNGVRTILVFVNQKVDRVANRKVDHLGAKKGVI